jgi:ribosome-binding protein aMBF1 (putative translation factor)
MGKTIAKFKGSDNTYGCDICGERKDWDNEIIWITSSYGVCEKCYNALTNEDKDKIRKDYE